MIFQQYVTIAEGLKTLTQRPLDSFCWVRFGTSLDTDDLHRPLEISDELGVTVTEIVRVRADGVRTTVYRVGSTYAVQPGRGKPCVMVRRDWQGIADDVKLEYESKSDMIQMGYEPLRILIESIRIGRLHDMTDADVIAEGFVNRPQYVAMWTKIHGLAGKDTWERNPLVCRLAFTVVSAAAV